MGDPGTYPVDGKHRAPDGFAHFISANLKRAPFFDQMACGLLSPDTHNELFVPEKYPLRCNH